MERQKLVLLVEDNPEDERVTLRALKKNNVMNEVVVTCTIADTRAFLEERHASNTVPRNPDLMVVDLGLGQEDGIAIIRGIKADQRFAAIPIVVFTGSSDPVRVQECYEAGANSFVVKPVNAEEFSDVVMQMAMFWLLLNQSPLKSL